LRHAASHDVISARVYAGAWVDVGTPERLAALNGVGGQSANLACNPSKEAL
jgi:NDP-sugar pyrophosphorylase family protein